MLEIVISQKVRRLGKTKRSKKKKVRRLEEDGKEDKEEKKDKEDASKERQLKKKKKKSKGKSKNKTIINRPVAADEYESSEEKGVTTWRANVSFKTALWSSAKFDIKIKAKAEKATESANYRIENMKYSILKHNNNPEEEAPEVEEKFLPDEVQVQQHDAKEAEEAKGIVNISGLSLEDLDAIIKRLTMVQTLDKKAKKQLIDLNLN